MFIFPPIADRDLGFVESFHCSRAETRVRFWELLLVNLVSQFISMAGVYVMYVGVLATVPIGLTIVATVYEERSTTPSRASVDKTHGDQ